VVRGHEPSMHWATRELVEDPGAVGEL